MLTANPAHLPANADVVIVGSGAVGLTMAAQLVAAGRTVVVIESGRQVIDPHYRAQNGGISSGRSFKGLEEGRYRGLGGTTRIWGGQLMRLSDGLIGPVPELNKPGWLIDADELAKWEDRVLGLLGVEQAFAEASRQWASKAMISPQLGLDLELALSFWLPRPDFAQHFAGVLAAPNGPMVLLEHQALGLICNRESGRVRGVRASGPAGEIEVTARAVVLACGTLENVALLLRHQAAMPQSPLAANRNVGRWFIDHLHGNVGTIRTLDPGMMGRFFDTRYGLAGLKVSTKLRPSNALSAKDPLAECAMTVTGALSPGEALHELGGLARRFTAPKGAAQAGDLGGKLRLLGPLIWTYLRHQRSGTFLSGQANFGVEVEQLPCAGSHIALERGVPPDQARIDLHWELDGREIEAVAALCQRFEWWCLATGYATVDYDRRIDRHDPAAFDLFHDSSHHMGGARMAASANDGVVDANLGVFGVPGLSVAGAAVFPSGGFANPTLSAMALGLRLADRLAAETAR